MMFNRIHNKKIGGNKKKDLNEVYLEILKCNYLSEKKKVLNI